MDLGSADDPDDAGETLVALNNRGEVALTVGRKAFLWHAGRRTPLTPVPDMPDMSVAGINDGGQAVGGVGLTSDGAILVTDGDAVLWSGGRATSLGALPDLCDAAATAINRHGQIVGTSGSASPMKFQDTVSGVTHAFLWDRGKMTDLGEGTAAGLNDATQIAGTLPFTHAEGNEATSASHAALWKRGAWRDLGTLPGWTFSAATGIGAGGDVAGYCFSGLQTDPSEAFLWRAGRMGDLGPGQALGIGRDDQVVGRSGGRAVLWWRGGLCDLNTCLGGAHGWVLTSADRINDRGQIVGLGTHHGRCRAFLLTPVRPLRLVRRRGVPQTARMHLVAAATGDGRITLCWRGVPGASGYDVYRGLASAPGATRANGAPVVTRDPGVLGGWVYTDRGLKNGVAYTYTVAALDGRGREIARSKPGQAAPDPNAPPWDTRDAAKIAAKIWANAQATDMPAMEEFGPTMPPTPQDFVAPDGVAYKDQVVRIPPSPYRYLAHPPVTYDAMDLGTLGRPVARPRGLNAGGLVVGDAQPPVGDPRPALPFLWRGGAMRALPTPPSEAPYGFATGINAGGTVCGYGNTAGRRQAALEWVGGGVRVLPPLAGGSSCAACGIGDAGQAVGRSADATGRDHMVWWDASGRIHDLGPGRLAGANAAGQFVGTRSGSGGASDRAVRVEDGVPRDLGTLGGLFSEGAAVNGRGDVVGRSDVAHGSGRGFLYSGGRMINLGLPPSALSSRADALSDAGVIVGSAATPSGRRAMIWRDGTMADLNDMTALPPGVTLTDATGISDRGQICATGRSGNTSRAYLLMPRPAR